MGCRRTVCISNSTSRGSYGSCCASSRRAKAVPATTRALLATAEGQVPQLCSGLFQRELLPLLLLPLLLLLLLQVEWLL